MTVNVNVVDVADALRVLGCSGGTATAADVLAAAPITLTAEQRVQVWTQLARPAERRDRDVALYESGWGDALVEAIAAVGVVRAGRRDLPWLETRLAGLADEQMEEQR